MIYIMLCNLVTITCDIVLHLLTKSKKFKKYLLNRFIKDKLVRNTYLKEDPSDLE